MDMPVNDYLWV